MKKIKTNLRIMYQAPKKRGSATIRGNMMCTVV